MEAERVVRASRYIPASPAAIFDILADARKHPLIDGSGSVVHVKKAPPRLFLGAKFAMNMKMGVRYLTTNKVVVFDEGRSIAWHHVAQFVWRYDLEPEGEGTRVTESFNYDKPWGFFIERLGWPQRNQKSMEETLERLAEVASSETITGS